MAHFRTHKFGELTWTEARDAAEKDPVVLIPSGAVEQHGPHLPLEEDAIVAEWVANYIAENYEAPTLVTPTLSYGHSPLFGGFEGTLNLSFETLRNTYADVLNGLVSHGFRRIVVINNNGGNQAALAQASYDLRQETGVLVGTVYPWSIGYRVMKDLYDDPAAAFGHGSEPEQSAMLAMFPDLIQKDLIEDGGLVQFEGWNPTNYSEAAIPGTTESGTLYWDFQDVSPSGVTGDPTLADADKGAQWVRRVANEVCLGFVREYDKNTKGKDWTKG
jgi:creatinine amidohydrolase